MQIRTELYSVGRADTGTGTEFVPLGKSKPERPRAAKVHIISKIYDASPPSNSNPLVFRVVVLKFTILLGVSNCYQ
jgi:hypothetical protein